MATKPTTDPTGLAETAAVVADVAAAEPEAPAPDTEVEAAEEAEGVSPDLAALNAGLVPMLHPNGGTCDLYKQDKAGNILVPCTEIAAMAEHGFVTVISFEAREV